MSKRKTWIGRIYLGRDDDGKQSFEWVGRFDTRRERDEAVAQARVDRKRKAEEPLPTCDKYVDQYLEEYARTHKDSSHDTEASRLKRFRDDFKGKSLDVSRQDAKTWAAKVPVSCVPPVVTMYNHAIDDDDLPLAKNPFRKLGRRSKGRGDQAPPTEAEFQAILNACSTLKEYGPRMRSFLLFAAFTLMRPSELFALEWADLDFDAMRINKARRLYRSQLAEPKTGPKTIALTPPARDALLGIPRTSQWVFTSKRGKRLSAPTMHAYWKLVCAHAHQDWDLYHATKHYGVWFMWTKLGMSNRAIAAQAGWSLRTVDRMLSIYGHGDVGALDEVDSAFEQAAVVQLRKVEGGTG